MSSSSFPYPFGTPVILTGLQKAPQHNGKSGTVEKVIGEDRQQVRLTESGQRLAVRAANLQLEPRPADSLSVKELKYILENSKDFAQSSLAGMDKSELRKAVSELHTPEENAEMLLTKLQQEENESKKSSSNNASSASPNTTTSAAASSQFSKEQLQSNAERLSSMDPAMLRQQANMLKTMPCSELRRMNPMFANMTDAQIRQAAAQFEMMAENPAMVKAAAEQMKNMSPEEVERQAQTFAGRQSTTGSSTGISNSNAAAPPSNPVDMMNQMNPEQLKQQAQMMKNMPPDQIRSMHPQFANMSDDQIKQISLQMERMADNPAMMNMVREQMKNMSPEDIKAMQEGRMPSNIGGGGDGGLDPAKLLSSMKGKDIKQMLKTAKENPDMLKQAMPNGSDTATMQAFVDRLEGMDEKTLDWIVSILATITAAVQPVLRGYSKLNKATGGHLFKILILLPVLWMLYRWLGPSSAASAISKVSPSAVVHDDIPDIPSPPAVEESEFADL